MKKNIFYAVTLLLLCIAAKGQPQVNRIVTPADEAFNKGMMYSFSGMLLPDMEQAKGFFKQALELGNTKADLELGKIYAKETSAESRITAAFYLEDAAKRGNTNAYTELGNLYYQTSLQYQDFAKAFDYFNKGSILGNSDCTAMTGYFYYKGLHKRQDYAKAFEYFKKAAEKENPLAIYFMGLQYRNGYGLERNADMARPLIAKSAGYNHQQALIELTMPQPENPLTPIAPPVIMQLNEVNGYKRMKHNMATTSVGGEYKGYAIRYDFSGKNILSVYPLQVDFNVSGNKVTGIWKEGSDTAIIDARCTESSLEFLNTSYHKIDHNSEKRGGEVWQFNNAKFNMLQQTDNTYITGNIQLYSPLRKEPGMPLYIHLTRATTTEEAKKIDNSGVTLTATNPFNSSLQVTFKIMQTTPVQLKLFTADGVQIFTQNAGILPAGTYTRRINVNSSMVGGSYVLQVETKAANKSITIVKL
jgi:uncharacterized protein